MKDWKTTTAGVLTAGIAILVYYKVLPQEAGALFFALGVAIMGYFAADKKEDTTV